MPKTNAKKTIYLDYAAGTPIDKSVQKKVDFVAKNIFGNPSSPHSRGREAREYLEQARKDIASVLSVKSDELFFTSSGTESNNLALLGVARAYKNFGKHIIVSKIEHHSVLRVCEYLEKHEGFTVTYINVDSKGVVNPEDIKITLRKDTILVSIMLANNEIGTIQPISKIARVILDYKKQTGNAWPFFHTDACQAGGLLSLNVHQLGVDLLSLNGSKIYGPRGVACLYKKAGVNVVPLMFGGDQEKGLRAGTHAVPLIVGIAEALKKAELNRKVEFARLTTMRDYVFNKIKASIPDVFINGDIKNRLANNINISILVLSGEELVVSLDQKDICVSTGSACASTSSEPSYVLKAMGLSDDRANSSIRVTLGRDTTKKDTDYFIQNLQVAVAQLRERLST